MSLANNIQKLRNVISSLEGKAGGGITIDPDKIIEKTVSGTTISVNDVSEIPHKCTVSVDKDARVWVGGKNLVDLNRAVLRDGVTPMPVVDNGVVWKAGNTYWFYILFDTPIPAGTTLYCNWDSETDSLGNDVRYCNVFDETFNDVSTTAGPGGVMITAKPAYGLNLGKIYGDVPVAEDIVISNIRVTAQVGEDYEPYNGASYNITAGQTVRVDSICPNMMLYSDNEATITLGYHKSWGMQTEYDRFWDSLQRNGEKKVYAGAFGSVWTDETFKPKYDIRPENANTMFEYSEIVDLKGCMERAGVVLDFSTVSYGRFTQFLQNSLITRIGVVDTTGSKDYTINYLFFGATKLKEIEAWVMTDDGTQKFAEANTFQQCPALEEIRIDGLLGCSMSWAGCSLLSAESVQSIIDHLKDLTGATAQKLTFHATVGAKLTQTQKDAISAKNWTLVY